MTVLVSVEQTAFQSNGTARDPLTVAEYFAGIGLFRMGLEAAGWQVVYANDWSPERAQMYGGFFGEQYQVRDIFSVNPDDVPQATLATCSFPCIDLSLAGKREGINGSRSGAFGGFYDILKNQGQQAPPIVVLENVTGWLYSNNGNDFRAVVKSLNGLGYACDVFMLNALSFVPQSRPRVFMVGIRMATEDEDRNRPTLRSSRLTPPKLARLMAVNSDLHWTQLDIPDPPTYKSNGFSECVVERTATDDPRWWPENKVRKHLEMMPPSHLTRVNRMAGQRGESFRTFFRRRRADGQRAEVRSDDIAGCLRTAIGGSGKQFLVAAGNGSIRMRNLTSREYARLQGVPDTFPIVSNTERQSLNAFGDAVCVPAISWIATEVLFPLTENIHATPRDCELGLRLSG